MAHSTQEVVGLPCGRSCTDFTLTAETGPRGVTIFVGGEIDLATSPALDRCAREHGPAALLTVDLTAVTFLDSSAMAALVGVARRARDTAQDLLLRPPADRSVLRMLEIAGLLEMLPFGADGRPARR